MTNDASIACIANALYGYASTQLRKNVYIKLIIRLIKRRADVSLVGAIRYKDDRLLHTIYSFPILSHNIAWGRIDYFSSSAIFQLQSF